MLININEGSKEKIKKILYVLFFITGFIIIASILSLLFEPKNNAKEDGMHDYLANGILTEQKNSIDVIFIGDSEAYSSCIPLQIFDEHGIPSYCVATSGQHLSMTYRMLMKTLENQSPKVVVLDTNVIYSNIPYDEASNNFISEIFPLFDYHDRWKSLKKEDLQLFSKKYTDTRPYKGYYYSDAVMPADTANYMASSDEIEDINLLNRFYINLIKKTCDKRGIKLILISVPSTKSWNMPRHNGIMKLSKELNTDYVDLNLLPDEVPIDWNTDSRDCGEHLNYHGAKKVTSYLGDYLSNTDILENRKGEKKYDSWTNGYNRFIKRVKSD